MLLEIIHEHFCVLKLRRTRNPGKWNGVSDVVYSGCKLYKPFKSKAKTSMRNCNRKGSSSLAPMTRKKAGCTKDIATYAFGMICYKQTNKQKAR